MHQEDVFPCDTYPQELADGIIGIQDSSPEAAPKWERRHYQPKVPPIYRQKYQLTAVPQNAANQYTVEPGADVNSADEYAPNNTEKTCYEQRPGKHPRQWTEQCGSSLYVTREYTASKDLQRHYVTDPCHQEILRPNDGDRDWLLSQVPNRYTREHPAGQHTEYTHGQDTRHLSGPRMEVNFQPSALLSQRLTETTM